MILPLWECHTKANGDSPQWFISPLPSFPTPRFYQKHMVKSLLSNYPGLWNGSHYFIKKQHFCIGRKNNNSTVFKNYYVDHNIYVLSSAFNIWNLYLFLHLFVFFVSDDPSNTSPQVPPARARKSKFFFILYMNYVCQDVCFTIWWIRNVCILYNRIFVSDFKM